MSSLPSFDLKIHTYVYWKKYDENPVAGNYPTYIPAGRRCYRRAILRGNVVSGNDLATHGTGWHLSSTSLHPEYFCPQIPLI